MAEDGGESSDRLLVFRIETSFGAELEIVELKGGGVAGGGVAGGRDRPRRVLFDSNEMQMRCTAATKEILSGKSRKYANDVPHSNGYVISRRRSYRPHLHRSLHHFLFPFQKNLIFQIVLNRSVFIRFDKESNKILQLENEIPRLPADLAISAPCVKITKSILQKFGIFTPCSIDSPRRDSKK